MPFGPFALQWRAPSPNPPEPSPLPKDISRTYIPTASGPLELLSALPESPSNNPPLFFAHGGFGCAEIWTPYMQFFAARGYPCYAVSYRGHGKSWYPGFWRMYFTSRATVAQDLVAGVEWVEEEEARRRGVAGQEKIRVVLVTHSAGGALSQYALSRGLMSVLGFCMLAAVPGFGSWSCYKFWALTAPIHFPYRLFHPRYILANTTQVHAAFFTPSTPTSVVKALERLLAPYESMLWPMQALFRFVTGPDVLSSITGWTPRKPSSSTSSQLAGEGKEAPGVSQRLLVLAAEHDVLCTPAISEDAARRYHSAFEQMVKVGQLEGLARGDVRTRKEQGSNWDGVGFTVVPGLGHHLQNDVEWERGAEEVLRWVSQLGEQE